MKDISELIKQIKRDKDYAESIEEIENIAIRTLKPTYFKDINTESIISRMQPECYSDITTPTILTHKFNEETLFYIFYTMNQSQMQIQAYNELIDRGFLYCLKLDQFVLFDREAKLDYKNRNILAFNPCRWEKENIEVVFDDEFFQSLQTKKYQLDDN